MTTLGLQDLGLFSDGSVIKKDALHFISSTLDSSPTWLVELLCGRLKDTHAVTLVTFQDHTSIHERGLKRYGIDTTTIRKSQFQLLDLSNKLYDTSKGKFEMAKVATLQAMIEKSLSTTSNPVLILSDIDVLLAGISALELLDLVAQLQSKTTAVYIVARTDEAMFYDSSPIAEQAQLFISQLLHKSSIYVSLRPLETGRADDVTGVLRVANGPRAVEEGTLSVTEGEYLYLVSDTIKLFYR